MENISRNVDRTIEHVTPPTVPKRKRHWDILLVDSHGKVISLSWLRNVIILLFICGLIICIAAASLFLLNGTSLRINKNSHEAIKNLRKELKSVKEERDILMARLVLEEGRDDLSQPAPETKTDPKEDSIPKTPSQEIAIAKKQSIPSSVASSSDKKPITSVQPRVNIADFSVTYDSVINRINVYFVVRNKTAGGIPVAGRIFVILKQNDKQESWITIPTVPIKDGKPTEDSITRGQYFKITNYKPVRLYARNILSPEQLKTATVFIYAISNALILHKNHPINLPPKPVKVKKNTVPQPVIHEKITKKDIIQQDRLQIEQQRVTQPTKPEESSGLKATPNIAPTTVPDNPEISNDTRRENVLERVVPETSLNNKPGGQISTPADTP